MQHILIANRAAIAVRAARTCRGLGLRTTALTARTDTQAGVHAAAADAEVAVDGWGLPDTYDSAERVLDAVDRCGVDAVYPGYGSLAENADFVAGLEEQGVTFVGPSAAALRLAGSKAAAAEAARRIGVPVLPHASGRGLDEVRAHVRGMGLPVVLKPEFGYGGQAVRIAHTDADIERAVAGGPEGTSWYVEKYLPVNQVVGVTLAVDHEGTVLPLGERESLLVADGLKLLEASPVAGVDAEVLAAMRADAALVAREFGLTNVMTVEFIVGPDRYYFLEVNGRLPLAYRMSESQLDTGPTGSGDLTGSGDRTGRVDLVELQLRIARGESVSPAAHPVDRTRHCLEARLFVHPQELGDFPDVGTLDRFELPDVDGVTYAWSVDSARPVTYELILAQALAADTSRAAAARLVRKAVDGARVTGLRCYVEEITRQLDDEC
ncbi:ATP-grasp domain-containing protein [Streptomyces sp. p1417]|uniref:ATP-grasp domain-containing protein n=1 Tax=Streptomyces typhae TaxID=2681492 RepID=A0A6L6X5F6_9ACTN|nr:biotin carboxylase N-terminal domain-containing protein [Streptomyces typhae]MVO88947.1 ATP-grasp domain-containing protein [Streptomyces typhae]